MSGGGKGRGRSQPEGNHPSFGAIAERTERSGGLHKQSAEDCWDTGCEAVREALPAPGAEVP
jgi:hypothetical protein